MAAGLRVSFCTQVSVPKRKEDNQKNMGKNLLATQAWLCPVTQSQETEADRRAGEVLIVTQQHDFCTQVCVHQRKKSNRKR